MNDLLHYDKLGRDVCLNVFRHTSLFLIKRKQLFDLSINSLTLSANFLVCGASSVYLSTSGINDSWMFFAPCLPVFPVKAPSHFSNKRCIFKLPRYLGLFSLAVRLEI